jgi:glycosyltransferase involved in cell wall biosynthesis
MDRHLNLLSIGLDDTLLVDDSAARGDAAARHRLYAQRLSRLDIVVMTRHRSIAQKRELASNAWVYATQSRHGALYVSDALNLSEQLRRDRGHIDVVTTQDPFLTGLTGYLLRRRWSVGLNVQLFSSFFDNPHWLSERPVNRVLNLLGKSLVRAADTVRVESPVERQHLVNLGVPAERVWVIPLLYNFQRFAQADGAAVRSRYLVGPYREMVLFVGRLAVEKDLPTLLRSVPELALSRPGARIVIVGHGQEETRLRQMVEDLHLGDRVVFAGSVSGDDLPPYFHACDVLVLPSIYEGIPTVLVEAAVSGKPVVSTRTRNVEDVVIDGQTGHLVPVGDPGAMATALAGVLSDPTLAAQMGQAGREHVQSRFSPQKVVSDLLAMWEATADKSQPRRWKPRGV